MYMDAKNQQKLSAKERTGSSVNQQSYQDNTFASLADNGEMDCFNNDDYEAKQLLLEGDDNLSLNLTTNIEAISSQSDMRNLKISIENDNTPDPTVAFVKMETEIPQDADDNAEHMKPEIHVELRTSTVSNRTAALLQDKTKVYENKLGTFVTGIDLSSQDTVTKRKERAERFGIVNNSEIDISGLYSSLGLKEDDVKEGNFRGIRPNAVMLKGVDDMDTKEIFSYFISYPPRNLEWIDDSSCNVVWPDIDSANRALLNMSKPIKLKQEAEVSSRNKMVIESDNLDLSLESAEHVSEPLEMSKKSTDQFIDDKESGVLIDDAEVPPGRWRVSTPHRKAKRLFMRLATKADLKIKGSEKRSEFYRKHGNPNYGNMIGLISRSKKQRFRKTQESLLAQEAHQAVHGGKRRESDDDLFGDVYVEPGDAPDPQPRPAVRRPIATDLRSLTSASRKRKVPVIEETEEMKDEDDAELEELLKSKKPFMKMRADDEAEKIDIIRSNSAAVTAALDARSKINRRKEQRYHQAEEKEEYLNKPDLRSRLSRQNI